jgi:MFS family permease
MTTALEKEKQNLWHHPNFLKLWASETISQFGTQFSGFGIPFTALLLTSNPLDFGILNATALLAFPLFALFIGVYVDRHHRRRIMVSANVGRGILLGLIPLAALTGVLRQLGMPLLYLVSFSVGVFSLMSRIKPSFHPSSKGTSSSKATANWKRAAQRRRSLGQA